VSWRELGMTSSKRCQKQFERALDVFGVSPVSESSAWWNTHYLDTEALEMQFTRDGLKVEEGQKKVSRANAGEASDLSFSPTKTRSREAVNGENT
jgi:hypothetical protein